MGARGQGQFVELLVAAVADGGGEKGEDMRRAAGAGGRTEWDGGRCREKEWLSAGRDGLQGNWGTGGHDRWYRRRARDAIQDTESRAADPHGGGGALHSAGRRMGRHKPLKAVERHPRRKAPMQDPHCAGFRALSRSAATSTSSPLYIRHRARVALRIPRTGPDEPRPFSNATLTNSCRGQ